MPSRPLAIFTANLITNAIKFTDKGSVTVTARYQRAEWVITVHDTGIGITKPQQGYIFDAFRQVDGSSTRSHGGTGLGLSIVRNLCTLMGGRVEVTSEPGEGSTFRVYLPLMTAPQPHTQDHAPSHALINR